MTSAREIIEALGGGEEVGLRYGVTRAAVHYWRKFNRFPLYLKAAIVGDAATRGIRVPEALFPVPQRRGRKPKVEA